MRQAGLVSVVIPVHNGARFVAQAIESVLRQTYHPVEVVAVNDGSTDGSAEVLREFGERIDVIEQANQGVAAARNAGVERAGGEYVAFLDQDDWWRETKVARQVEALRSNAKVGLVHTAVAYFDESCGEFVGPQNPLARPEQMIGECFEQLLMGNAICNSSVAVRRSVLKQAGGCNVRLGANTCQDYDLWLRIARIAEFGFVNEELTVFRLHGGQGHKDRRRMLRAELDVLLSCRAECEWCRSPAGRQRLAALYDELATAHFDAGDSAAARRYFYKALRIRTDRRQFVRFGVSCLPHAVASRVRSGVGAIRSWMQR